jgi:hypothetical protein
MKRGETTYLSSESKCLLGLSEDATQEEQRDALDAQCHHETDLDVNTYLFKIMTARRFELVCVNPDGEREKRRGDHLCWYPKDRVQEQKCHFTAGGHDRSTPEAALYEARGYHAEFYNFKTSFVSRGKGARKLRLVG